MNEERLATLIERPDVQQKLLRNYDGDYSIGITLDPRNKSRIAIRVRIAGHSTKNIPAQIEIDGETIPVVVSPNFKVPVPFRQIA
ncbi:MAG: hypothetical protein M3R14_10220 [Acidobacteriota bacterium]|nr:hypothetical protein [Acidobacteriota bacterium]